MLSIKRFVVTIASSSFLMALDPILQVLAIIGGVEKSRIIDHEGYAEMDEQKLVMPGKK
jgi:hypothetical protein